MGDKKKNRKKHKKDDSLIDVLTREADLVGAAIAAPVTGTIAAIEDVGDSARNAVGAITEDVVDVVKDTSGGAKHLVANTAEGAAGTVQAVIDTVKPDGKSGKKNKKDGKKDGKKSKKK